MLLSSIESNGFTWTFVSPVECGQYEDGSWWAQGPLELSSILPLPAVRDDGTAKNGSMIASDLKNLQQSLDGLLALASPYSEEGNIALTIASGNSKFLNPGQRILSASSSDSFPPLASVGVLTCVSSVVPSGTFRPGYSDSSYDYIGASSWIDDLEYRLASLDIDSVLTKVIGDTDAVASSVSGFLFDPFQGPYSNYLRPGNSTVIDDSTLEAITSEASLLLNLSPSLYWTGGTVKSDIVKSLVQRGIDYYFNTINIPNNQTNKSSSVRKFLILFAGAILQDSNMLSVGFSLPTTLYGTNLFKEDLQTFTVESTGSSVNYGYGAYAASDVGLPEWGVKHWDDPSLDSASWVNVSSYGSDLRRFFTMRNWGGYLLASKIMGLQYAWNHPHLFSYFNRYYEKELELVPTLSGTSVKEALAPEGKEWIYDAISGTNSYYFDGNSSNTVDGIEFYGISTKFDTLLYASSFTSPSSVEVLVTNPIRSGSGVLVVGTPLINSVCNSSSIVYVLNSSENQSSLVSASASLDVYRIPLTQPVTYAQVLWFNEEGLVESSSNAIKITL
jgi:hypothetical protein